MSKPNSDVVRSFDPKFFQWFNGKNEHGSKDEIKIRIYKDGTIFISSLGAKKFAKYTSLTESGFYRAEIGIAKKAIAIRPLPPEETGYRFRPSRASGLVASCSKLVKTLEWDLPLVVTATWDEKNKMIVAKVE